MRAIVTYGHDYMNDLKENRAMEEVTSWLEAGIALREKLLAERERLLMRVAEVDEALAALPPEQDASDSAPEKIRRVLRGVSEPLTAPQIIDAIRAVDPAIAPRLVHSALHRLVKKEEVLAEGEAGSRSYRWSRQEERTAMT